MRFKDSNENTSLLGCGIIGLLAAAVPVSIFIGGVAVIAYAVKWVIS